MVEESEISLAEGTPELAYARAVDGLIEPKPTEEDVLSTIRKLADKRNKIDSTILSLKEQLIGMVKKL